jgi:transposase
MEVLMEAYSKEFRRDVLASCDAGEATRDVAIRFRVSESWIRRIRQDRRESGKVAPKTTRNRKRAWESWHDWLMKKIDSRPDIYLREIQADLKSELGVDASLWTICQACRAVKRTRKKRR